MAFEYSRAPRAEDASLQPAQMELARGDRTTVMNYVDQRTLEHSEGRLRAERFFQLPRPCLVEGALTDACAILGDERARLKPTEVELVPRLASNCRHCEGRIPGEDPLAQAVGGLARGAQSARNNLFTDFHISTATDATVGATIREAGRTAQDAAYFRRVSFEWLVRNLKARRIGARVNVEGPYRVRRGNFTRRADAAAEVVNLMGHKITAMVVED